MKREFKVEANVGKPQVAYRETITAGRRRGIQAHQADRRPRAVRPRQAARRAERARQGRRLRQRDRRRRHPARSSSRRSRRACARRATAASWPASRWSTSRSRSSTAATTTSTRSAMAFELARLARPARRPPGKAHPILLEPVMTVEVVDPRRLHRGGDRRFERAPRQNRWNGVARWCTDADRRGSAVADVRLRDGGSLGYTGSRDVHDGVRTLRPGARRQLPRASSMRMGA